MNNSNKSPFLKGNNSSELNDSEEELVPGRKWDPSNGANLNRRLYSVVQCGVIEDGDSSQNGVEFLITKPTACPYFAR